MDINFYMLVDRIAQEGNVSIGARQEKTFKKSIKSALHHIKTPDNEYQLVRVFSDWAERCAAANWIEGLDVLDQTRPFKENQTKSGQENWARPSILDEAMKNNSFEAFGHLFSKFSPASQTVVLRYAIEQDRILFVRHIAKNTDGLSSLGLSQKAYSKLLNLAVCQDPPHYEIANILLPLGNPLFLVADIFKVIQKKKLFDQKTVSAETLSFVRGADFLWETATSEHIKDFFQDPFQMDDIVRGVELFEYFIDRSATPFFNARWAKVNLLKNLPPLTPTRHRSKM